MGTKRTKPHRRPAKPPVQTVRMICERIMADLGWAAEDILDVVFALADNDSRFNELLADRLRESSAESLLTLSEDELVPTPDA